MAIIFDGKQVALEKEGELTKQIGKLRKRGVAPTAVSILVGNNTASKKYLSLKKKAAERVGVELEIKRFQEGKSVDQLIKLIKNFNKNKDVHGIMIQLPLPSSFSNKDRDEIIGVIEKLKDVDGMREDSMHVAPVVKSVLKAIGDAYQYTIYNREAKVVVVGAKGFVGKKLLNVLKDMDYKVRGVDVDVKDLPNITKLADILISVTGVAGLVDGRMVKSGSVVIDVGSPDGDVVTKEVLRKVKFISPVPGGVGPLTIYYLLENLVEAALSPGKEIA